MNNHFDWPFPQKQDTMYLSSINYRNNQRSISQDYKYTTNEEKRVLTNKPHYNLMTQDLYLPKKQQKSHSIMDISDIPGTQPNIVKFVTQRESNPVEPIYKIPSFTQAQPPEPRKFIRDTLNVTDIPGTDINIKIYKPRKDNPFTEVEGSRPRQQKYVKKIQLREQVNTPPRNYRHLDPLQPKYEWVNGEIVGEVQGSHPTNRHPDKNKNKSTSLHTYDIRGAQAGTLRPVVVNDPRHLTKTDDIDGAQAGTVKRGMQTKRCVHPLDPKYKLLGQNEIYN